MLQKYFKIFSDLFLSSGWEDPFFVVLHKFTIRLVAVHILFINAPYTDYRQSKTFLFFSFKKERLVMFFIITPGLITRGLLFFKVLSVFWTGSQKRPAIPV